MLDTKNLCLLGFKILSAVAVGAAVVLGIDKLSGSKNQQQNNAGQPVNMGDQNQNINQPAWNNNMPVQQNSGNSTCDNILEGLRTTQNICKGVISVGAAIGGVVQCIGQLSDCINGRQINYGYQGNQMNNMNNTIFGNYYNQRYNNQPQMINSNGKEPLTLVRRSAYVVSCVPASQAQQMQQF